MYPAALFALEKKLRDPRPKATDKIAMATAPKIHALVRGGSPAWRCLSHSRLVSAPSPPARHEPADSQNRLRKEQPTHWLRPRGTHTPTARYVLARSGRVPPYSSAVLG